MRAHVAHLFFQIGSCFSFMQISIDTEKTTVWRAQQQCVLIKKLFLMCQGITVQSVNIYSVRWLKSEDLTAKQWAELVMDLCGNLQIQATLVPQFITSNPLFHCFQIVTDKLLLSEYWTSSLATFSKTSSKPAAVDCNDAGREQSFKGIPGCVNTCSTIKMFFHIETFLCLIIYILMHFSFSLWYLFISLNPSRPTTCSRCWNEVTDKI